MPKTFLVKCSYYLPVELPDDMVEDADFHLEENSCAGTKELGALFDEALWASEINHNCWACALAGENEIVDNPELLETVKKSYEWLVKVENRRDYTVVFQDRKGARHKRVFYQGEPMVNVLRELRSFEDHRIITVFPEEI